MRIVIRGAGDLASGIAVRLHRSGFEVIMTDIKKPTAIRRTVSFCQAIVAGESKVEDILGVYAPSVESALEILKQGHIPVLVDPEGACLAELSPHGVVDAILAKQNLGTHMHMAPVVVGVGPGFTAGVDCHAVVETQRGHDLGRVYYTGSAAPNTGRPGNIGGYTVERILRAPADGTFTALKDIGDLVEQGEIVAYVEGRPVIAAINGVLRGILATGTSVYAGMKSGDIDPRPVQAHCFTVSDKARSIGGGVLEALLHVTALNRV